MSTKTNNQTNESFFAPLIFWANNLFFQVYYYFYPESFWNDFNDCPTTERDNILKHRSFLQLAPSFTSHNLFTGLHVEGIIVDTLIYLTIHNSFTQDGQSFFNSLDKDTKANIINSVYESHSHFETPLCFETYMQEMGIEEEEYNSAKNPAGDQTWTQFVLSFTPDRLKPFISPQSPTSVTQNPALQTKKRVDEFPSASYNTPPTSPTRYN